MQVPFTFFFLMEKLFIREVWTGPITTITTSQRERDTALLPDCWFTSCASTDSKIV